MFSYRFSQTLLLSYLFFANCPSFVSAETQALSKEEENLIYSDMKNIANDPGTASFTPPQGWRIADPKALPKTVKAMVVGAGAHEFPPSINLGTESYPGTLKQYLKRIKEINNSKGAQWKDLGTIQTDAGAANLSQVELKNQWGDVKMMHAILLKDGVIYIMTASSLKEEFPRFYKEFFSSLRSLKINSI